MSEQMTDTKRPQINRSVDSSLRARIAAIIDTHTAAGAEGQVTCWCDSEQFGSFHAHSLHAADAVIAELGLHRHDQDFSTTASQQVHMYRYFTDWIMQAKGQETAVRNSTPPKC